MSPHQATRPSILTLVIAPTVILAASAAIAAGQQSTPVRVHVSPEADDFFGITVSACGDVNGDEVGDYAVAGPGPINGSVFIYSGADGSTLHTLGIYNGLDFFGLGLAPIGDVNADGYDDLAVSAPLLNIYGRVSVYSGFNGAVLWARDGQQEAEVFGWAIAEMGDVNNDGTKDLVVSSFGYDAAGPTARMAASRSALARLAQRC